MIEEDESEYYYHLHHSSSSSSFVRGSARLMKSSRFNFVRYLFSRKSILARLVLSLLPPIGQADYIPKDIEGACLCVVLLICVLGRHVSRIGHTFLLYLPPCYVGAFSIFLWIITNFTRTRITFRELLCLISYGLFGHTVALFISLVSSKLFIPSLVIFGGLGSLRICVILLFRTRIPAYCFVVCTLTAVIHLLFLVYLQVFILGSKLSI